MRIFKSLIFILLFSLSGVLYAQNKKETAIIQDIIQLWYPYQVNVLPNCNNKPFDRTFPFTTNSKREVSLFSFKTNSNEFILLYEDKEIKENDTISLTEKKPAIFKIRFKGVPRKQDSVYLSFETSVDSMEIFRKGSIQFLFNKYVISQDEVMDRKSQIVELSKSCLDKINVIFPFGGTETFIDLYNSKNLKKPFKTIWYEFKPNAKNYITFSKKDVGRYLVKFAAHHWGTGFWLTIK